MILVDMSLQYSRLLYNVLVFPDPVGPVINTTPVGLKETDPCAIDPKLLHSNLFVYDIITEPAETKLLHAAKLRGAGTYNAYGKILYESMLTFQIWTDKLAPLKAIESALEARKRPKIVNVVALVIIAVFFIACLIFFVSLFFGDVKVYDVVE